MRRVRVLGLVLVCCVAVSINGGERGVEGAAKKWENTISQFEEWDSKEQLSGGRGFVCGQLEHSDVADSGELP